MRDAVHRVAWRAAGEAEIPEGRSPLVRPLAWDSDALEVCVEGLALRLSGFSTAPKPPVQTQAPPPSRKAARSLPSRTSYARKRFANCFTMPSASASATMSMCS
jgi:hypothetical protein